MLIAGALPLAWLVIAALSDTATSGAGLVSSRTATLFGDTVRLGVVVAVLVGVLGTISGVLLTKTDLPGRRGLLALLTFPREAEGLCWVTQGKTNPEIAVILGTRSKTVSKQLERIYQKLGVETRTAAATLALIMSSST